jgi:hypothetical protein
MGLFGHPTISNSAPRIFDPPVFDSPLLLDMEKLQCLWCPLWVIGPRKRQWQRRTYDPHELIDMCCIIAPFGPSSSFFPFLMGHALKLL